MSMLSNAIITVRNMNLAQTEIDPDEFILLLKQRISLKYPQTLKVFRLVDIDLTENNTCKGFYLVKRPHKKHGFLFYVRYIHNGKTLPSMWNTHTNSRKLAELFAKNNRERLVEEYLAKTDCCLFTILETYYKTGSKFLIGDQTINGGLCEKLRRHYLNFIVKRFIPFLKSQKVYTFAAVTPAVIARLQSALLKDGVKPQTINNYMSSIKRIYKNLIRTGEIKENVFKNVSALTAFRDNIKIRGCHDLEKLNGVFNDEWAEDKRLYLLCLLIYSTGLRNSEIEKLKVSDILKIDDCCFLNVRESKTCNGVRIAPLHNFPHKKLTDYIGEKGLTDDNFIFKKKNTQKICSDLYKNANLLLAKKLNLDEAYLNNNHITFYSGRHFWKTLMNSEELGVEIEELFMGHSVSGDVAKRYNHRDKIGKEKLLEKTRKVFAILNDKLFGKPAA